MDTELTPEKVKIKQVIVIRKDLNMRRGKEIVQGAHASSSIIIAKLFNFSHPIHGWFERLEPEIIEWVQTGFTKICVVVNSEKELLDLEKLAKEANLRNSIICDSGRTEFNGIPTYTCLAIGPNNAEEIDKITGNLKLY